MTHRNSFPAAAAALEAGGLIMAVDDRALGGAGRGFLVHAAVLATPATVNQAILAARGLTCFAVTPAQAMRLGLTMAGHYRADLAGPVFLRSVEAAGCTGTGISAADRAETLRAAGDPAATMQSLKSPGHVFPAMTGGGSSVADQARAVLTALTAHDVAAWCDVLDDEGEVAGAKACRALADRLGLPCVTVADFDDAAKSGHDRVQVLGVPA